MFAQLVRRTCTASLASVAIALSSCTGGGASSASPATTAASANARGSLTALAPASQRRTLDELDCQAGGKTKDQFVGGGEGNAAAATYSAVVGGWENRACSYSSFIGGGNQNGITYDAEYAVIAGGQSNSVSGEYGFVGGGTNNTVSGEGAYVGGGGYNAASGEGAIVDGGFDSSAGGAFATIPGGYGDSAGGTYSFAAGARASAPYTGNFVWSDGSDGTTILTATANYQFLARASGGFTLYTNPGSTVGAQLAAGSGTWASLSDRNAKTAIVPLDDDAVLAKVDALPISRWSYKSEHGVRHVGPMAQDFYAAFKVGEDDRHITSIDEDGIALAAVKALHADNRRLHEENRSLRAQLVELRVAIERLQER